ncbi:lipopolysaccharide biosynthesis protein [Odoribacter sp. OttesenSCG-928-L07]|nr:lipopolysaccharide biosynthesis protein [Odoribacter sp. OttesenSCG-928-L07]MDL2239390.1 lipopolysaccharide biosynthesis protein [Bacteroidales bacterium OttesenSCG-928-L14]MDL2240958.1 lipopolysaccharide biosynthesis protein [Bacteroidales bacterium OttesenSCG-928-K22]
MAEQLKDKAVKGVKWSFIDNIAGSGITFLVGLVLARILSPAEFGIIGMVTIFISISNSIIDSGLSNALIRKLDTTEKDYNTVFYTNLILGALLYAVLFFCSPAIAKFFSEPILTPILRTIGIVLVFNALCIIQRTILIKRIDFKTQTKVSLIASTVSGFIGIGMALNGYGVWSLVGQQISRQLFNFIFFWVFNKWRPTLIFSLQSFKEMFGFGYKLLLSGLIDTIYKEIYHLIIGKFYSKDELGQYTRANQFKTIFSSNLTAVVQRVSYPTLSEIQNNPQQLLSAYRKIIKSTMLVTFACMLGLGAIAKPLILTLIGEKWLPAAEYLQIICFSGMLYPLHALNLNMLQVKGRSDLFLKLEIIKKILAVIPICLGIFLGIKFMLWGSVFNSFVAYFLNSYYSGRLVNYSTRKQIIDILPTFGVSVFVALVMWSVTLINLSPIILLLLQIVIGISLAIIIYSIINLEEYNEIKKMALSMLKKK